jgi:hypothetical protein
MVTTDNLATVTAAGYLNSVNMEGYPLSTNDIVEAFYSYNTTTQTGTYAVFGVAISGTGVITLTELANPGDVLLPVVSGDFATFNGTTGQIKDAGFLPSNPAKTKVVMANGAVIANHIATYTDTAGTIGDDAATAINGGNIQAGLSGTAGTLSSFPSAATSGSLKIAAVANTGDTITTLSNDAMGQASTINIPDPANAVGQLLIGATATPFVSGNFPQNSGTAGLMVDSGIAVSALATTSTAVLLSPAADQTITAHSLTVAQGDLTAGSSGHQGTVAAFPAGALAGKLVLSAIGNTGNTDVTISNAIMGQASVISIPDPGAGTADFLLSASSLGTQSVTGRILQTGNPIVATNVVTATAAALATAGKVNVWVAPTVTAQIAILDIKVFLSTGLSGGGGDRLLSLADGTLVFNDTGITAALLGTPIFTLWGGTGNPIASAAEATISTAGANVYLQYISGTTDFTTGSVIVAVTYAQVTA